MRFRVEGLARFLEFGVWDLGSRVLGVGFDFADTFDPNTLP